MSSPEQFFSEPSRQSPLAVVFLAWRIIRQISVVNLVFVAIAISSGRLPVSGLALAALVVAVLGIAAAISWWRFVFVIEDGELRVDRGVLSQEHLAIPINRIQTVSLEQGLLHQILGLTQVSVDTAGSSVVEFKFDALDRQQAEHLQQVVANHHASTLARRDADIGEASAGPLVDVDQVGSLADAPAPTGPPVGGTAMPSDLGSGPTRSAAGAAPATAVIPPPPMPEPEVLATRSITDLVKIWMGSWPWAGLVVIFPLLAVFDELQQLIGIDVFSGVTDRLDDVGSDGLTSDVSTSLLLLSVVSFLIVATITGWLFQVVRSVLTHWELTLSRIHTASGDSLRRDAGLFNRTTLSANLARVQGLRSFQAPLQRLFGIHNTTLLITGETNLAIPGATAAEIDVIKKLTLPQPDPVLDREISRSHILRELRSASVVGAVVGAVTGVTLGWWGLLALIIPVQASIGATMYWKSMRWGFTDQRIGYRHGMINRRMHDVEFVKAQSVLVRQSWFERRRGLATFRLESAEAELSIPFISKAEADALRDLVLYHVETSLRSWM